MCVCTNRLIIAQCSCLATYYFIFHYLNVWYLCCVVCGKCLVEEGEEFRFNQSNSLRKKCKYSHYLLPQCWWKFRWRFVVHKTFLEQIWWLLAPENQNGVGLNAKPEASEQTMCGITVGLYLDCVSKCFSTLKS